VTDFDEGWPYAVRREQGPSLVAACRRADGMARLVAARLHAAGLGAAVRRVVGVLDAWGCPQVQVSITLDGLRRLSSLIATTPGLLPDEVLHPPIGPTGGKERLRLPNRPVQGLSDGTTRTSTIRS
jgi:hypothetical protein